MILLKMKPCSVNTSHYSWKTAALKVVNTETKLVLIACCSHVLW